MAGDQLPAIDHQERFSEAQLSPNLLQSKSHAAALLVFIDRNFLNWRIAAKAAFGPLRSFAQLPHDLHNTLFDRQKGGIYAQIGYPSLIVPVLDCRPRWRG
jgi:hypothetical protein